MAALRAKSLGDLLLEADYALNQDKEMGFILVPTVVSFVAGFLLKKYFPEARGSGVLRPRRYIICRTAMCRDAWRSESS